MTTFFRPIPDFYLLVTNSTNSIFDFLRSVRRFEGRGNEETLRNEWDNKNEEFLV